MIFGTALATGQTIGSFGTVSYIAPALDWPILIAVVIITIVQDRQCCCKETPTQVTPVDEQSKQYQAKQDQRKKSGSSRMVWYVSTEF